MRRRVKVGKPFDISVSVETPDPEKSRSSSRRVAVGEDFEAEIAITGDVGDAVDAITRSRIVWAVFATMAIFLFGAAGYGFYHSEFGELQGVWGVTAPVYGGIAGYFFWRPDNGRGTEKK
jgi:hypothetical protein